MTYKAFEVRLTVLCAQAELVRFPTAFDADESEIRELFLPPALLETLQQRDPKKARDYNANIRAFISRFVKGDDIDNMNYMKSWQDDIFELRVQNQRPKQRLRIFGAFGKEDTFIALFRRPRDYFGGKEDPRWGQEIRRAVHLWEGLFPGVVRVRAQPFSNCVTSKYFDQFL